EMSASTRSAQSAAAVRGRSFAPCVPGLQLPRPRDRASCPPRTQTPVRPSPAWGTFPPKSDEISYFRPGELEFSQAALPQRRMRDRHGSGNLEPTGTGYYAKFLTFHIRTPQVGSIFCLVNAENRATRFFSPGALRSFFD